MDHTEVCILARFQEAWEAAQDVPTAARTEVLAWALLGLGGLGPSPAPPRTGAPGRACFLRGGCVLSLCLEQPSALPLPFSAR